MFSAMFLTCMLSALGETSCNVSYMEMPTYVQDKNQCDQVTAQMYEFALMKLAEDFPDMTAVRKEQVCYGGPLSAGMVAHDEHAKLLEGGVDASLLEIP